MDLADVSGHGVPAALVASMVKVAVAAEADRYDSPGEILTGVNRALTGKFESAYVTACCFVVDPARNALPTPRLATRRRSCAGPTVASSASITAASC